MTQPLLKLDSVTKEFGNLIATNNVTRNIGQESVTALIGPNGAGKTTLYNLITGRLSPTSGQIWFNGEDITDDTPVERTRRGLSRSFQINNIFKDLTVFENLRAPVIARSDQRWNPIGRASNNEAINRETREVLELVGLKDISNQVCSQLSYGDKRRVEIGIVLATDPDMVLLDEPTAGMNPTETKEMVELIENLDVQTDMSFFITEHDIPIIFSISDRILVLDRGEIIADGTPEEIRQNDEVQTAYLGGEI